MDKMPKELKQKLRKLHKLTIETQRLNFEIEALFKSYGVNANDLSAMGNGEWQTESLAFIANAEGNIEENIKDIEQVFLCYINEQQK